MAILQPVLLPSTGLLRRCLDRSDCLANAFLQSDQAVAGTSSVFHFDVDHAACGLCSTGVKPSCSPLTGGSGVGHSSVDQSESVEGENGIQGEKSSGTCVERRSRGRDRAQRRTAGHHRTMERHMHRTGTIQGIHWLAGRRKLSRRHTRHCSRRRRRSHC